MRLDLTDITSFSPPIWLHDAWVCQLNLKLWLDWRTRGEMSLDILPMLAIIITHARFIQWVEVLRESIRILAKDFARICDSSIILQEPYTRILVNLLARIYYENGLFSYSSQISDPDCNKNHKILKSVFFHKGHTRYHRYWTGDSGHCHSGGGG